MKTTGILRQLDSLGRIVLPVDMRRALGVSERDTLELALEGEIITLRKHAESCVFCGATEELSEYKSHAVCAKCRAALAG